MTEHEHEYVYTVTCDICCDDHCGVACLHCDHIDWYCDRFEEESNL